MRADNGGASEGDEARSAEEPERLNLSNYSLPRLRGRIVQVRDGVKAARVAAKWFAKRGDYDAARANEARARELSEHVDELLEHYHERHPEEGDCGRVHHRPRLSVRIERNGR